jgi:rod shape-determining protein MreD
MMARIDQSPGIRPRATLGRRLDIAARRGFPVGSTILLMLITEAPFNIIGQAAFLPAVTLAAVWFWSVHRPTSLPPPLVFGIGVLLDLRGYLPLGTGVLTLLLVHGVALRLRRVFGQQRFAVVWLAFVVVAAGSSALTWLLVVLLTVRLTPAGPAVFQAVLTAALYPALAIPLAAAHRSIADPERA